MIGVNKTREAPNRYTGKNINIDIIDTGIQSNKPGF
jgi:hypothetical protein